MIDRILADLILVAHLVFIAFVVGGGLMALRWRGAPAIQIPAAVWGVYIELSGGVCPLTPLENELRRAAGASGYPGGFIEHYLVPLIYPAGFSYPLQLALAATVVVCNLLVYLAVWRLRRRSHR